MVAITETSQSVSNLIRESGVGQILDFNTGEGSTQAGKLRMASISWGEKGAIKLQNLQEMMELSLRDFLFDIPQGLYKSCTQIENF